MKRWFRNFWPSASEWGYSQDNARYHHASLHQDWRQAHEPAFVVAFLAPYSPELNPMERVWKLVRRLCLHTSTSASWPCWLRYWSKSLQSGQMAVPHWSNCVAQHSMRNYLSRYGYRPSGNQEQKGTLT